MSDYYNDYIAGVKDRLIQLGDIKISDLRLTVRTLNCLKNMDIIMLSQLTQRTESELLAGRHLGRKSLFEIKDLLRDIGLTLASASIREGSQGQPVMSPFEINVRIQYLLQEKARIDSEIARLQELAKVPTHIHVQTTEEETEQKQKDTRERERLSGGNPHLAKIIQLAGITEREAIVLRERATKTTFKAIGEMLGLSLHRARDIEGQALRKLRHPTRRMKLQDEIHAVGLCGKVGGLDCCPQGKNG